MDGGAWQAAVHEVTKSQTRLSDFTFTFHFHALGKEMVTHSSVLAWRIPRMAEPDGLPSMGSHRVRHYWSDLAAAWQKTTQHYKAIILESKVNIFFSLICSLSLEHYFYIEYFTNHFFLSKLYLYFPIFKKETLIF